MMIALSGSGPLLTIPGRTMKGLVFAVPSPTLDVCFHVESIGQHLADSIMACDLLVMHTPESTQLVGVEARLSKSFKFCKLVNGKSSTVVVMSNLPHHITLKLYTSCNTMQQSKSLHLLVAHGHTPSLVGCQIQIGKMPGDMKVYNTSMQTVSHKMILSCISCRESLKKIAVGVISPPQRKIAQQPQHDVCQHVI